MDGKKPGTEVTLSGNHENRAMCFEQGKVFVREAGERPGTIVAEWPDGTVDTHDPESGTMTPPAA